MSFLGTFVSPGDPTTVLTVQIVWGIIFTTCLVVSFPEFFKKVYESIKMKVVARPRRLYKSTGNLQGKVKERSRRNWRRIANWMCLTAILLLMVNSIIGNLLVAAGLLTQTIQGSYWSQPFPQIIVVVAQYIFIPAFLAVAIAFRVILALIHYTPPTQIRIKSPVLAKLQHGSPVLPGTSQPARVEYPPPASTHVEPLNTKQPQTPASIVKQSKADTMSDLPLLTRAQDVAARGNYIQLKRQYEYVGGKVRVKVVVKNTCSKGLFRLNMSLDIPHSLKLLRIEPPDYPREGTTVKIGELLTTDEKSVAWVLEPLICGKEKVGGAASGLDNNEKPFAVPMEPLLVEVRCPLFVQPEEANLPTVQRIAKDLPVHSERNYLLPELLSFDDAYEVATNAIAERDVRLVASVVDGGGSEKSAWFYGTTKVGQKRYVMTASVHEKERVIQLSTACDDEAGCTGFLAEVGRSVRQELVARGAVDREDRVRELYCTRCGEPLPLTAVKGGIVTCPKCQWTCPLKDFPI